MAAPRLHMSGIRKRFGGTIALDGVDLSVHAGEVLALVGENGAGKSTLMKVLSGAHAADAGIVLLDGEPYRPRSPLDARRAGVSMIYQELSLALHLTVAENVLLGMEPVAGPFLRRKQMQQIARDALGQLGRPDISPAAVVGRLSIADRQLVEIARALVVGCRVLVLDEPTSSLTHRDTHRLFEIVNGLKQTGHAIVYISHFLEEVRRISDRYTVLRDGRSVGNGATANASTKDLIAMMVGRDVGELYPRSKRVRGRRVCRFDSLAGSSAHSNNPPALLRSASLEIHRGEVVGIAGLVGAGRTQMLRAIFGLDRAAANDIEIAGEPGFVSPKQRWRQGAGLVSEDRTLEGLALNLSVADNLTLSKLPAISSPGWRGRQSRRWIERLGIRCRSAAVAVDALSGGNQQKIAIARLLHHDVDLWLLDEPTRGIDVGSKAQIYQIIDDLARSGKAVLMVSSYLPELLGVCDRIAVMCRGVLGPALPTNEWTEHAILSAATGDNAQPLDSPERLN